MRRLRSSVAAAGLAGTALALALAFAPSASAASASPAPATSRTPPSVTIHSSSKNKAVSGDVYVTFHGGRYASATLSGVASGVHSRSKATLLSQAFPFKLPPVALRSEALSSSTAGARYSFSVSPAVGTRYFVEVTAPGTARPETRSRSLTIYVTSGSKFVGHYTSCNTAGNRPVCHQRFADDVYLPAGVARFELAKHVYSYLGVALAPGPVPPPPPRTLHLSKWKVSRARLSASTYLFRYSFSFYVGNDGYEFGWNVCWKDTFSTDGFGLPGHNGCGNPSVSSNTTYLG
ncbi:MAG: hypothetical protein ACRDZ5_10535 [Acidimicrobiales bacterium]